MDLGVDDAWGRPASGTYKKVPAGRRGQASIRRPCARHVPARAGRSRRRFRSCAPHLNRAPRRLLSNWRGGVDGERQAGEAGVERPAAAGRRRGAPRRQPHAQRTVVGRWRGVPSTTLPRSGASASSKPLGHEEHSVGLKGHEGRSVVGSRFMVIYARSSAAMSMRVATIRSPSATSRRRTAVQKCNAAVEPAAPSPSMATFPMSGTQGGRRSEPSAVA